MTPNQREEFIFDLANHKVKQLSQAGIFAMAVDQMCMLLANESEDGSFHINTTILRNYIFDFNRQLGFLFVP